MGNGNWATDPNYASKVIDLYNRMRADAGLPGV
jgi:flagellum-specific peptidoglycan hydrolase FlgJ